MHLDLPLDIPVGSVRERALSALGGLAIALCWLRSDRTGSDDWQPARFGDLGRGDLGRGDVAGGDVGGEAAAENARP